MTLVLVENLVKQTRKQENVDVNLLKAQAYGDVLRLILSKHYDVYTIRDMVHEVLKLESL